MKVFNYDTAYKIASAEVEEVIQDRYIMALYNIRNRTRRALSKINRM